MTVNTESFIRGAVVLANRTRSISIHWLMFLMTATALSAQDQTNPPPSGIPGIVGPHGDPRTFDFSGQEWFRPEDFVRGLQYSLDFQLAAGSDQPMGALLSQTEKLMLLGFQKNGHPDATVAVTWDARAEKIAMHIDEGPRFVNGHVRVVGGTTLDTNAFRILLLSTNKVAAGQLEGIEIEEVTADIEPIWTIGENTAFDSVSANSELRMITNMLALAGHPFARVSHELIRNDDGTCDMLVTILDEGPQATIGTIRIENAKRNPPEKILERLDFKPGDPYHLSIDDVIRHNLIDGGRFIDYRLTVSSPDEKGVMDLTIAVRELMSAPPLGEELTEVQQLLMKCERWFESPDRSDIDIEVKFVDIESEHVLGRTVLSDAGFFGEVGATKDYFRSIVLITGTNAVFAVPELDRAVAFPVSGGVVVNFVTSASPEWDQPNQFNFEISAGVSSIKNEGVPVVLNTPMLPAAFLSFADNMPQPPKLEATRLVLEGNPLSLSIDRATGRLLQAVGSYDGMRMEANTGEGLLVAAQHSVMRESESLRNQVATERPVSSGIAGVVRLFFAQPFVGALFANGMKNTRNAQKLSDILQLPDWERVMEPFDQIGLFTEEGENRFDLPSDLSSIGNAPPSAGAGYGVWMVGLADDLFAHNSGLWLFSRGMGFFLADKGSSGLEQFVDSDKAKNSPAGGPLAYWIISRVAAKTGLIDDLAKETARTSYRLLSPAQFRDEVAALLGDPSIFSRCTQQLGYAIAEDNDADIEKIAEALGQPWSRFVRETATAIRTKGDQPLVNVWLPVWEHFYRDGLEEMLEDDLFRMMSSQ